MKKLFAALYLNFAVAAICAAADTPISHYIQPNGDTLSIERMASNALRVTRHPAGAKDIPCLYYIDNPQYTGESACDAEYDPTNGSITFKDSFGTPILTAANGMMVPYDQGWASGQEFIGPDDEMIFGTGQFQDGYLNIKGLSRRLTQVNTQISIPMIISSAGYGILWNNCGMTDFNPCDNQVDLKPLGETKETTKVNVTGTEGNKQEERTTKTFVAEIDVPDSGEYALLLDCGQKMARKHFLQVDKAIVTQADNLWLPPTTSAKVYLTKGKHTITVEGDKNDSPTLYWRKDDGTTTFSSPVSQGIDYTVFIGSPDEIIASMRQLTGHVPMMPKWAFGYIHCRERYDTQQELLSNASEFRTRQIPIDMIVQDWQWWGKNGWNAMQFDSDKYPDPKAMTDSLHAMDMRIMLSVWAKVDRNSVLGKQFEADSVYIKDTDWIDFFNPQAAEAYWTAYRNNLLPTGIDAWWQDATEPENDDLAGRRVDGGKLSGDIVRNVFPLAVNDRVYKGLCEERPNQRPMILTRCGAPGLQRYGAVTWSGDVGNDWQTLSRQIIGGLGQMACGLPWWTYDAGGFFRPEGQYNDTDYQDRMIRWIQASVYLPLMRVHGYMSQTEPWRYSPQTQERFVDAIKQRYQLIPYIYSCAAAVSQDDATLMRPLVFDFPHDKDALEASLQYMFGPNLLVCPVTSEFPIMEVYLPFTPGGWYDFHSNQRITDETSQAIPMVVNDNNIPVFVKAGSIMPWIDDVKSIQSTADIPSIDHLTLKVYPGADGRFTLYEDDGVTNQYAEGLYARIPMEWHDSTRTLNIGEQQGKMPLPYSDFRIVLPDGKAKDIKYRGQAISVQL